MSMKNRRKKRRRKSMLMETVTTVTEAKHRWSHCIINIIIHNPNRLDLHYSHFGFNPTKKNERKKNRKQLDMVDQCERFRWKRQHIRRIKCHHFEFIHTIFAFVLDHVFVLDIECCTLLLQMKYENEVKLVHKHILKLLPSPYMLTRELA